MAILYKALTELYRETQRKVTAPDQWQAFLASACRNYRLTFDEQLLVYAQRPDATAVLEIERWNRQFGRWVVVFESLYRDDVEITTHKDIEDKDQTVTITPPPDVPQTGDNSNLGVWIGLGGIALGGAIACVIMYFKKKKDDGEK